MKVFSYDDGVGDRDQAHVIGRDVFLKIDHTLRQNEPSKKRVDSRKGLGLGNIHQPDCGVSQEFLDQPGAQFADQDEDIGLAIFECLGRSWTCDLQYRCVVSIDAVCGARRRRQCCEAPGSRDRVQVFPYSGRPKARRNRL
jgi:hypothetical protein